MRNLRILSIFLAVILFTSVLGITASAEFESSAGAAVIMEFSTGQILYEKNADVAMPPASITKLMTLTLAFEALEKGEVGLEDPVTISEKAWKMEGSKMFIEVGKKVPFGELLKGISIVSGNDACIAVAEHLYGSEKAFVEAMNKKAAEMGLERTHFENSHGYPAEGHVMSAKEIAILARHLIEKYPQILEIESQKEYTFGGITQYNRNPLLGKYPGADGLKTGHTDEAGYCLVGTAVQDGRRLIAVVLKTPDEAARLTAAQELLNHGFKNFKMRELAKPGDILGTSDVKDGKKATVNLTIENSVSAIVPIDRENEIERVFTETTTLKAPVSKGTSAGTVTFQLDGKILGSAKLVTTEDIKKTGFFERLFKSIGNFFKNLFG